MKQLALLFIISGLLLINGCTSQPTQPADKPSPVATEKPPAASKTVSSQVYMVRKGDTLYGIARRHGLSVNQLAALNNLRPPYAIYPGQRLAVSNNAVTTTPVATSPTQRTSKPPLKQVARGEAQAKINVPTAPANSQCYPPVQWSYPAQGSMQAHVNAAGRRGILIRGRLGQPIKAAAAGTVIYSGNVLQGYRNLIIIQHNPAFLSVYANNQQRWVQEGSRIQAGQTIAIMGLDSNNQAALHFEIRCQGKAVDPNLYLPN